MAEKKNGNLLKLKKQLKEGILAPLYVFYGEEDYLREMYVNRVKDCVPDGGFPDFNHIKIEGRDVAFSEYDDAWESFPMMTDKKLIHIKDSGIFQLKSGKDEASTEEKKEFWTEKFKRISDDTVVIFDETAVDKRSALYKAAAKAGGQRAHSARSKTPAHRSRRGSVVTRDGVLTNDTRSPRQKRR